MITSESISKVTAALVQAKAALNNPSKSGKNPHFKSKYTTLDELENHIRPVLAQHGLCALTPAQSSEGGVGVAALIVHESGEYLQFDPLILPLDKRNAQGAGSAITYAMRYALCSALSIAGEEDDDGNRAARFAPEPKRELSAEELKVQRMIDTIKADFADASADQKAAVKEVMAVHGFQTFKDEGIPFEALEKISQILTV